MSITMIELDTFDLPSGGWKLKDCVTDAIQIASQKGAKVKFTFNGVSVIVEGSSNPETIWRDYIRASRGYIGREVGPHPTLVLPDEVLAREAELDAQAEARRQEAQTAAQKAAESKRQEVEAKLALAPAMEITNLRTWEAWVESNQDPYGREVLGFAERWAKLMQLQLQSGLALESIAMSTSHEADIEGISGAQFGFAAGVLITTWSHGEELKAWHDKR